MTEPRIREATADDASALAAVYRSAYAQNRELGFPATAESATAATVRDWMEDGIVLAATLPAPHAAGEGPLVVGDDRIVGGARLAETDPGLAKLSRVGVHADWKGKGIGSALLDRAEAVAAEWGCETVWLTTPPEHPFLADLYRARGYQRTGDYPLEYREYDEIVMEKPLDGETS